MKWHYIINFSVLAFIVLVTLVLTIYYRNSYDGKISDYLIALSGIFVGIQLSYALNEIEKDRKNLQNRKLLLIKLMDELENNYQKLSSIGNNADLVTSTFEAIKFGNGLDLIDYDTRYKLEELYERINRINSEIDRILNFVYSYAEKLEDFQQLRNELQAQIERDKLNTKDLCAHVICLIEQKYKIPSKLHM